MNRQTQKRVSNDCDEKEKDDGDGDGDDDDDDVNDDDIDITDHNDVEILPNQPSEEDTEMNNSTEVESITPDVQTNPPSFPETGLSTSDTPSHEDLATQTIEKLKDQVYYFKLDWVFFDSNVKIQFYTGLPKTNALKAVYEINAPYVETTSSTKLSKISAINLDFVEITTRTS